jgi:predicted nucleic acid-binding protein
VRVSVVTPFDSEVVAVYSVSEAGVSTLDVVFELLEMLEFELVVTFDVLSDEQPAIVKASANADAPTISLIRTFVSLLQII